MAIKKIFTVFLFSFIFLIVLELYLRFYWGFCDAVLSQESNKYEYIAQPNQNRFRFRKHVRYNEFSMRSEPVRKDTKARVLVFGDSVVNGGVMTDQDSLATTIVERMLNREEKRREEKRREEKRREEKRREEKRREERQDVQVLNISYGSWGPDNCFAFMQAYGDFDADMIVLVVSSHDAYDNMTFEKVIDVFPSYPSKQYTLATYELWDRYLLPHLLNIRKEEKDPIKNGGIFNPGFQCFYDYTEKKNIPFWIYLHPTRNELTNRKYDNQGNEIVRFCTENEVPLLCGLAYEEDSGYRDNIHLNERG